MNSESTRIELVVVLESTVLWFSPNNEKIEST